MTESGYIYLIQDGKYIGTNVYKFGRTVQTGDARRLIRLKSYSPGTIQYNIWKVNSNIIVEIENEIKMTFNKNYKKFKGHEWFEGDVAKMRNDIDCIINKFHQKEIQQNKYDEMINEIEKLEQNNNEINKYIQINMKKLDMNDKRNIRLINQIFRYLNLTTNFRFNLNKKNKTYFESYFKKVYFIYNIFDVFYESWDTIKENNSFYNIGNEQICFKNDYFLCLDLRESLQNNNDLNDYLCLYEESIIHDFILNIKWISTHFLFSNKGYDCNKFIDEMIEFNDNCELFDCYIIVDPTSDFQLLKDILQEYFQIVNNTIHTNIDINKAYINGLLRLDSIDAYYDHCNYKHDDSDDSDNHNDIMSFYDDYYEYYCKTKSRFEYYGYIKKFSDDEDDEDENEEDKEYEEDYENEEDYDQNEDNEDKQENKEYNRDDIYKQQEEENTQDKQ